MERHSLIHHIQKQQRFAHAIIARYTLAQHTRKQQSLPQALGLRAKTAQPLSETATQSARRVQPLVSPFIEPAFQTPPTSYAQNEAATSPIQPINEQQAISNLQTLHVNQHTPEQDVKAIAETTSKAENIPSIPSDPAPSTIRNRTSPIFASHEKTTSATNQQEISKQPYITKKPVDSLQERLTDGLSQQMLSVPGISFDIPDQQLASISETLANVSDQQGTSIPDKFATIPDQQTSILDQAAILDQQVISAPETFINVPVQETIRPDILDTQHIATDKQNQRLSSSPDISSDLTPQQTVQADQQQNEPDQAKQHTDPLSSFKQDLEADTIVQDQPAQSSSLINEPLDTSNRDPKQNNSYREDQDPTSPTEKALDLSPEQKQPLREKQKPIVEHTQEQRPRKRGRIEEQPHGPTSSHNQSARLSQETQYNDQKAKISEVPSTNTDTDTKNNEEQPTNDIATAKTTKFSPQEWYARLVRAEQAAQEAQNVQSALVNIPRQIQEQTFTIPHQQIQNIERSGEQAIPDEKVATINNQPVINAGHIDEPTVRNERTSTDSSPFVEKATNSNRAPAVTNELATPTPLSQRARRFLRPLVGIDPNSVHIHRDQQAEQLTTTYHADAVTIGNDVALAADHPDDTPETLGLLAHELTHIARLREPRFIPPIARPATSPNQRPQSRVGVPEIDDTFTSAIRYNTSVSEDEETLAQRVEARTIRAARNVISPEARANNLWAGSTEATSTHTENPVVPTESRAAGNVWGGLPAPWEPLPEWLVEARPDGATSTTSTQIAQRSNGAGIGASTAYKSGDGGTVTTDNSGAMSVQRAGKERSFIHDEANNSPARRSAAHNAQELEPDLDDLARQVYTRLKHRLGVENRRTR